jgi:hypothetical protein
MVATCVDAQILVLPHALKSPLKVIGMQMQILKGLQINCSVKTHSSGVLNVICFQGQARKACTDNKTFLVTNAATDIP